MLTRMVYSLVALLLAAPALAQTTQPAELTGTLTGDKVALRSGPSTTGSYVCTRVNIGDKVVIVQSKGEWLQVKPIKGTFSVVAKKYVAPDAAGKAGVVNADNVWVRAAGEQCTFTAVTDFYGLQGQLNKDDKVEILGDSGDFYKITSPAFATFWIASKYVDLGGKAAPGTTGGDPIVSEVTPKDPGTTTQPEVVVNTVPEAPAEPTYDPASVRGKVEAVRKEMMAEYAKPAEQRDLKRIIEKFKAIETGDDKYAKQVVEYYTTHMQNQLKTIDDIATIDKSIKDQQTIVTKVLTDLNTRQIAAQTETGPKAFNAQGVLKASGLFPGTKVTPKRWIVSDPATGRITGYVQCTNGAVNLDNFVGKQMGVWGSEVYDKDLGLYIVEAKEVKELAPAGTEPIPSQPTTKPAVTTTAPAPKVVVAPAPKPLPTTQPTTKPAAPEAAKPAVAGPVKPAVAEPAKPAPADPNTTIHPVFKADPAAPTVDSATEVISTPKAAEPTTKPAAGATVSPSAPDDL